MPSVLAEFLLLTRNKTTNFKESLISSLALIHNYINNSYFVYYREKEANVIYIIYKKTVMMRVDENEPPNKRDVLIQINITTYIIVSAN